jgi:tripartite-type tricarboxylate transporter receptor subunit TctC
MLTYRLDALRRLIAGATALVVLNSAASFAQDYPARTITIVVPFPGGGTTDLVPRILQDGMAATLGQSLVIENRTGASGTPGSLSVSRALPDGYTILSTVAPTHSMNMFMQKNFPYDPVKSFTPIVLLASTPMFLTVHPSLPVKTLPELIEHARSNPGKLVFGSAGPGTGQHIMGELIKKKANVDMVHLPYRGTGPMMADLLGGQFPVGFATPTAVLAPAEAGRLRIIAVTDTKRLSYMPNVPTMNETMQGMEFISWLAMFAPPGTPRAIVDKINAAANKELKTPRVIAKLREQGVDPIGGTPEDLLAYMQKDIERWRIDIPLAGIDPQ